MASRAAAALDRAVRRVGPAPTRRATIATLRLRRRHGVELGVLNDEVLRELGANLSADVVDEHLPFTCDDPGDGGKRDVCGADLRHLHSGGEIGVDEAAVNA